MFFGGLEARATAGSASALSNPNSWLYNWFTGGGGESAAGVTVTEETAIGVSAVYAAVNRISRATSSLPLKAYKVLPDGGREEQPGALPPSVASVFWRRTMQSDVLLWGNGYSEIEFDGAGRPVAVHRRHPSRVTPERIGGELKFRVTNKSKPDSILSSEQVVHVQNFSTDGVAGISPIRAHREAIGVALAAEKSAGSFFGNGMQMGGFLSHPGALSQEAGDRLRHDWEKNHKGTDRAHRMAILEEGMDYKQSSIPPEEAQFLETRKFQVTDIARIFDIPPHMIGDMEHATFSNIEQQSLEFVKFTLLPWLVLWEQELTVKLLSGGVFAKNSVAALERGDFKTRTDGYASMIQNGVMAINEARGLEEMNPVEGGDRLWIQMNLQPLDAPVQPQPDGERIGKPGSLLRAQQMPEYWETVGEGVSEARSRRSMESRWKLRDAFLAVLEAEAGRLVASEVKAVRKKLKSLPADGSAAFEDWLTEFFHDHRSTAEKIMGPVFAALIEASAREAAEEVDHDLADDDVQAFAVSYSEQFGVRHTRGRENQILALLSEATTDEEAQELIGQRLDEWTEKTAHKVARMEATQSAAAAAVFVYGVAGVATLVWRTRSGACPLCKKFEGKVVSVGTNFANAGDVVDPEDGETNPLRVRKQVGHPPLHGPECRCGVSPG